MEDCEHDWEKIEEEQIYVGHCTTRWFFKKVCLKCEKCVDEIQDYYDRKAKEEAEKKRRAAKAKEIWSRNMNS